MIELYTKQNCPYCVKAKNVLNSLNVQYSNYVVEQDISRDSILEMFPLARSYPIVVVNGEFIGGYTELEMRVFEERENFGKQFLAGWYV